MMGLKKENLRSDFFFEDIEQGFLKCLGSDPFPEKENFGQNQKKILKDFFENFVKFCDPPIFGI